MLLDCILAPAFVLPAPGWQVAEQAHAASAQEQRLLRLALTYYTPAQAASRLGVRMRQLGQVVPPSPTRVHYRRDEVDALAAQGQKVSLAALCQRA